MRVHTFIELDFTTGEILSDEYYEYDGPVAMAKGGGTEFPAPSAEEKALQAAQTQLLQDQSVIIKEQIRQQELLAPLLFKEAGVTPITAQQDLRRQLDPLVTRRDELVGELGPLPPEAVQLQGQLSTLNTQLGGIPETVTQTITGTRGGFQGGIGGRDPGPLPSSTTTSANPEFAALQEQIAGIQGQLEGFPSATTPEIDALNAQIAGFEQQIGGLEDPSQIIAFEEIIDPNEALRGGIETSLLERTQAALAGELPVNPALLSDLEEEEELLNEQLRKQLGPGFRTSTPGIEALGNFQQRKEEILEASRRGDLTLTESLSLARETSTQSNIDAFLGRVAGVGALPLQGAAAISGTAAGYDAPLNRLFGARQQQQAGAIASQQASSQTLAGLFGAAGSIGGGIATGLLIA